jgi:hypothetical protein
MEQAKNEESKYSQMIDKKYVLSVEELLDKLIQLKTNRDNLPKNKVN